MKEGDKEDGDWKWEKTENMQSKNINANSNAIRMLPRRGVGIFTL